MSRAARCQFSLNLLGSETILGGGISAYVDAARRAESAGLQGVVMPDHVVMGDRLDRYPFHRWDMPPDMDWPEPMIVLSAIAGATVNLQLATSVLIAPLRPAVVVAKQAATLHNLSRGRFSLGVGVGWQREEYEACSVDFDERRQHLEEQLSAWQGLWSQISPTSFESRSVNFNNLWCHPKPWKDQTIPLWLGVAPTQGNCRTLVQYDAGWAAIKPDPSFIRSGLNSIAQVREAAGITAKATLVRTSPPISYDCNGKPDWNQILEGMEELAHAGVTHLDFPVSFLAADNDTFEELLAWIRQISAAPFMTDGD